MNRVENGRRGFFSRLFSRKSKTQTIPMLQKKPLQKWSQASDEEIFDTLLEREDLVDPAIVAAYAFNLADESQKREVEAYVKVAPEFAGHISHLRSEHELMFREDEERQVSFWKGWLASFTITSLRPATLQPSFSFADSDKGDERWKKIEFPDGVAAMGGVTFRDGSATVSVQSSDWTPGSLLIVSAKALIDDLTAHEILPVLEDAVPCFKLSVPVESEQAFEVSFRLLRNAEIDDDLSQEIVQAYAGADSRQSEAWFMWAEKNESSAHAPARGAASWILHDAQILNEDEEED